MGHTTRKQSAITLYFNLNNGSNFQVFDKRQFHHCIGPHSFYKPSWHLNLFKGINIFLKNDGY